MTKVNLRNDILICTGILVLFIAVGTYQKKVPDQSIYNKLTESINYLPSGTFLKGMALGYDEALGDFLWVRAVGYFGVHSKTDRDYTWLIHMLQLIIELDPRYESPYEFAGLILPSALNDVDTAIAFLKKGVVNIPRHNPRYWLQPFYLGFCYMIYKNQPIQAAHYFEIAATFPQSPPFLKLLVTRLYGSENKPELGIQFIQNLLDEAKSGVSLNEHTRSALEKRLKELTVIQHIQMMEAAVSEYRSRYNAKPSHLRDLVSSGILPSIPVEPFGGRYFLSEDGEKVFSSKSERSIKLHNKNLRPQLKVAPLPNKPQ